MAEGRERSADSAMFLPFVGNVVEGEGILVMVSVCSTCTC